MELKKAIIRAKKEVRDCMISYEVIDSKTQDVILQGMFRPVSNWMEPLKVHLRDMAEAFRSSLEKKGYIYALNYGG